MNITKTKLMKIINEVLNESVRDMFESGVEYANTAIETLINAGEIPKPSQTEINEDYQSINLTYDSDEDLQKAADYLYLELRIPKQKGGGWRQRPRFMTGRTNDGGGYISISVPK